MIEGKVVFARAERGDQLPLHRFTLTPDALSKYLWAVDDDSGAFQRTEAPCEPRMGPPWAIALAVTEVLGSCLPPGSIQSRQHYRFYRPMKVGEILTTRGEIIDKFERKGRKYVVFLITTAAADGQLVVESKATVIVPE